MTTRQTKCSKCDGAGRIEGFGHIEQGRCFACGGSGRVDGTITNAQVIAALTHNAHIATEALLTGDTQRAEFYAARTAKDMHKAGHANALAALNRIAEGRFYDDDDRLQVRPDLGRQAAEMIIAAGRAA